jgi:hypothetical protein
VKTPNLFDLSPEELDSFLTLPGPDETDTSWDNELWVNTDYGRYLLAKLDEEARGKA